MNRFEAQTQHYLHHRLQPYLEWSTDDDVLRWDGAGPTIAFRLELAALLTPERTRGLPPLCCIALLLSPLKDSWSEARTCVELWLSSTHDPSLLPLLTSLDRLAHFRTTYQDLIKLKRVLIATFLDETDIVRTSPEEADEILNKLNAPSERLVKPYAQTLLISFDYLAELHSVERFLRDLTAESLRSLIESGVREAPQPATLPELPAQRSRELIQDLLDSEQEQSVARIALRILAALSIPRRVSDPEEIQIGGVSDIANRGTLDRLLVSELANDELTLSVRLAMREALFLRRESPPRKTSFSRDILLDTGIRTWGIPRLIIASIALALACESDPQINTNIFSSCQQEAEPCDFTTQAGVREHLSRVTPTLDCRQAIPRFLQVSNVTNSGDESEAVIVTTTETARDPSFRAHCSESIASCPNRRGLSSNTWVIAVDRSGMVELLRMTPAAMIREMRIELDLIQLLSSTSANKSPFDSAKQSNLPYFCQLQPPLPLSLPIAFEPSELIPTGKKGEWLVLGDDQSLYRIPSPSIGPQWIAGNLPPGKVLWHSSSAIDSKIRMMLGVPMTGKVTLLEYNRETRAVRSIDLSAPSDDAFLRFADSPPFVLAFGARRIYSFDYQGKRVDSLTLNNFFHLESNFIARTSPPACLLVTTPLGKIEIAELTDHPHIVDAVSILHPQQLDSKPLALLRSGDLLDIPLKHVIATQRSSTISSTNLEISKVEGHDSERNRYLLSNKKGEKFELNIHANVIMPKLSRKSTLEYFYPSESPKRYPPLRKKFIGVAISNNNFWLLDRSARMVSVSVSPHGLILEPSGALAGPAIDRHLFGSPIQQKGYQLSHTRIGKLQIWLDSRGLLHFKSDDENKPELTLILKEGLMAGWSSKDGSFGQEYFTGNLSSKPFYHVKENTYLPLLRDAQ